jgi:5-methylcytosine-specific restriction protein A
MEHGGKDWIDTQARKEFNSLYQTAFWKNKRVQQLSINPLCQACLKVGRVTQANHIDHVFAWNTLGRDAFYNNLFQSLCLECHSHKTGLEKQGIYRCYIGETKDYALHEYKFIVGSTPSHASNVL